MKIREESDLKIRSDFLNYGDLRMMMKKSKVKNGVLLRIM